MKLKKADILPPEHFIGSWYIPKKVCSDLVKWFKRNHELGHTHQGVFTREKQPVVVDKTIKESIDLQVSSQNAEPEILAYRKCLQLCLDNYIKDYPDLGTVEKFNICEDINIQYYKKGGGYKNFHFERSGNRSLKRMLVFMTYLNDVKNGGTDFKYQKFTSPAKKGLTLIWPPDWTHAHRSQVSKDAEKCIITGWYSFLDNENT